MFDLDRCYDSFATSPNEAYFWSGLGKNGQSVAADIARENGGVTLEMLMEKNKDLLIESGFEYDKELNRFIFSPENLDDWKAISNAYAEQVSGDTRVILGDRVRDDSVWNTKELPALSENENVNRVISVDPQNGQDKGVLLDKTQNRDIDLEKDLGLKPTTTGTSTTDSLRTSVSNGLK
ncbi:MAG: hypothetical protein IJ292_04580 [Clostridia bacterium]|nr:hypothetical protein [Clostridia bacterium]